MREKPGTTSACAENTAHSRAPSCHRRNYLRVRGEYACFSVMRAPTRELPPRARRIRFASEIVCKLLGTTSACAENTITEPTPPNHQWNYLRVRGEYPDHGGHRLQDSELPPRARRIP